MKQTIIIFLLFFLFCPVFSNALSREEMDQIGLEEVIKFGLPNGYSAFQGMAITNQYIVVSASKVDNSEAALVIFQRSSLEHVRTIEHLPFGHANDITYDEATNEIHVVNGKTLHVLDGNTFEIKGQKTLGVSAGGISKRDGKYIALAQKKMYVYDENFTLQNSFAADTNLVTQGIAYYDGLIFYPCYETGRVTTYEPVYDGVLDAGDNVIYVYDTNGVLQKTFYIPSGYGEIEAIDFFNGRCYLLFNSPDYQNGILYTFSYDNHATASTTVYMNFDQKGFPIASSFKANIYQGDNLIKTVPMTDGAYQLSFDFNNPGIYEYRVNQVTENQFIHYDAKDIFVTFLVDYDIISNKLKVSQLSNNLPSFDNAVNKSAISCEEISGIYYDKDGNVTNRDVFVESCHVVENPQTGFPVPVVIIASGCIICSGFFLYLCGRKRIYHI